MPITIARLQPGAGAQWRSAVDTLVPEVDREGELLSVDEAESSLADDRCYLLVAAIDSRPIGLVSAFRFPDVECGGSIVYLYDIEVAKDQRKQGIGKRLITQLLELCDADDVDLVWAGTESNNDAARALFEATGAELDSDSYTEYEWELDDE